MSATVTVVDYECGNLFSISRAIEHCGGTVALTSDPEAVVGADRLLLPGVGAFGAAMDTLHARGLFDAVLEFADSGRPFLGVCVGMQAMMDYSEEFGRNAGLGFIAGGVAPIPDTGIDGAPHPVPHIGWAPLSPGPRGWDGTIFDTIEPGEAVYFVHSFAARPDESGAIAATCDYDGHAVTAALAHGSLFGCQFHPEKSGPTGLRIIDRFLAF